VSTTNITGVTASDITGMACRQSPTVTVAIAAFTLDRWELLVRAVESAGSQTMAPTQIVLCIDNNLELLERCRREWKEPLPSGVAVEVIPNEHTDHLEGRGEYQRVHGRVHGGERRFGAGRVRTTALYHATGDIVAFLDDDAEAEPEWLENLVEVYRDDAVIAVGGESLPNFETERPSWFPREFDWVFGCSYTGTPRTVAPIKHMIGANMSARRQCLLEVGGFHAIDLDDMDICHRLAHRYPDGFIMYQPHAIVHHYVSRKRVTWEYFWRRCYHMNKVKVGTLAELGDAANLQSERDFVTKILTKQVLLHLREFAAGDVHAAARLAVSLGGTGLAGLGNLAGRAALRRDTIRNGRADSLPDPGEPHEGPTHLPPAGLNGHAQQHPH
jgi:GT2 family glycosyltransferase